VHNYGDQRLMPSTSYQSFWIGLQLLIMTFKVTFRKPKKKHSSLDSWMSTEHNMLRWNSNMELILTLLLQSIWSTTKECIQKQISKDKWLIASARTFYTNSSASLDCINELRCAIDSRVATVNKNFTSQHQIKRLNLARCNMWNSLHETNGKYDSLNSMKSQLQYYHTTYCSCSYLVNCIYEYFTATDFTLANFTLWSKFETRKHHRIISQYTTLLPQNNLQLHIH